MAGWPISRDAASGIPTDPQCNVVPTVVAKEIKGCRRRSNLVPGGAVLLLVNRSHGVYFQVSIEKMKYILNKTDTTNRINNAEITVRDRHCGVRSLIRHLHLLNPL